jgi:hypothetical protein
MLADTGRAVGRSFSPDDVTDAEALAALARITGGTVRLVQRLFAHIERVVAINRLRTISKEVVETAREHLVIGLLTYPAPTAQTPPKITATQRSKSQPNRVNRTAR